MPNMRMMVPRFEITTARNHANTREAFWPRRAEVMLRSCVLWKYLSAGAVGMLLFAQSAYVAPPILASNGRVQLVQKKEAEPPPTAPPPTQPPPTAPPPTAPPSTL